MKIKKLLAIFLSAMLLLSLFACGENITPKEDEKEPPATPEDAPKEDDTIPFSYGRLPIITDEIAAVWEMNVIDFENEYGNTILDYVYVYSTKETYYSDLDLGFLELLEHDANLPPTAQEMVACVERYDEAFFEKNQLLTVTLVSITSYGYTVHAEKITPVTAENGNVTYHVQLRLKHNEFGSDGLVVGASTVSIELDKSLNISRENVVVEILNK